jgi:hypothetical protein
MRLLTITCICLLLAAAPAIAQKKYLKKFQREHRHNASTLRIGLGFWVKMGGAILPARAIDGEEGVIIKRMLRKTGRMKLYLISGADSSVINNGDIRQLRQTLATRSGLEPLFEIRDQGSYIYMMNKGKGEELGNVVLLIRDEQDLAILHFHTRMQMSDIQDLINRSVASDDSQAALD